MERSPQWFTAVMGTGIVAGAAATLPVEVPGLLAAARLVWALDVVLLLVLVGHTAPAWGRWRAEPSPFLGAPAMALMTVAAGALLLGVPAPGHALAAWLVLWGLGTALGLVVATTVPRHVVAAPTATRLLPVVPPMVSAATGPLLLPHLPTPWHAPLLAVCGGLFALTLLLAAPLVARVCRERGVPPASVPALWIVLGPLGQSVTAAHTLGDAGPRAVAPVALGYGLMAWGAAVLWLAVVVHATARAARRGLPFGLSWWAFTFPLGTVVTGTSGLAAATGAAPFVLGAVVLYAALVVTWCVVAVRTVGLVSRGWRIPEAPSRRSPSVARSVPPPATPSSSPVPSTPTGSPGRPSSPTSVAAC
jgi:tellurite resistance protein TehA-like permease